MWIFLILFLGLGKALSSDMDDNDDSSRKILGSSVVTSVSVILDSGNGNKATFSDAVGKPVLKPQVAKLASPIELLNPDRYEFYTFDESGDLVKRLMTMEEIKAIIATSGDEVFNIDNFSDIIPENRVNDIVNNVQNVLREEIESHKMPDTNQLFDTPDVSDSWSMILPAIFGNSGEEIKPEKTATASTPETLVIGPTQTEATTMKSTETTTTLNPLSHFTSYFVQGSTTEATKIKGNLVTRTSYITPKTSTSQTPSSTERTSTNKLIVSQISPQASVSTQSTNKIFPTTDSTTLKVQIFPNSNTNLEGPFGTLTTGGTSPDSEYVRIRTPKPEPPLQSRISSSILEQTSPSLIRTSAATTSKFSLTQTESSSTVKPFMRSSTPISSSSTKSTIEYTKHENQPEASEVSTAVFEKLNSLANFKSTTKEENEVIRTPSTIPYNNISTTSQSTEKIYILLRPLNVSTKTTVNSISPSTTDKLDSISSIVSTSTQSNTKTNYLNGNTHTQSIFTIIPQKPAISTVPILPQTTTIYNLKVTEPTATESQENKKTNNFSTQLNDDYTHSMSDSIYRPYITTQSHLPHEDHNSVVTTSAGVAINKTPSYNSSSNYTENAFEKSSTTYKQPDITTITPLLSATFSEVQNTASISNNQNTFNKGDVSELPVTHFTEGEIENAQTVSTITDNSEKTESVSSYGELQKDLLEKLLLSSTNVNEINSAVNQELTYPIETTLFSEEFITEIPLQRNGSTIEVNPTLIESIGQLIAQAVGNISEVTSMENKTSYFNSAMDTTDSTITTRFETFNPSTNLHDSTTYFQDVESTKYAELTENTDERATETTENMFASTIPILNKFNDLERDHIINISIFRKQNSTKPAKADLSLEIYYDSLSSNHTEMKKQTTANSETATIPWDLITSNESTILQESTTQLDNQGTNYSHLNKSNTGPQGDYVTLISTDGNTHSYSDYTTEVEQNVATQKLNILPSTSHSITTLNTRPSSVNFDKGDDAWTLVSTIAPHGKVPTIERKPTLAPILEPTPTVDLAGRPMQGFGLEESTASLDADVYHFVQLCNELAFGFWKSVTTGISTARSVIVSPFAATSLLAMVFLGARGSTSGEMNEILKLDNMVTFNPHLTFKTVTESILTGPDFGVATSAIVRQLYSDKSKERILNFYKERARFFYDGHVEEVSFKAVGDTIRRRTNLLIKKQTNGKVQEFLKDGSVRVRSPLAAISGSVMQTDCSKGSITDRDGEIHFVVFPSIKQRRLIPIPAVVYREGFLAGYEPSLDATAVALGDKDDIISFIFVLPGRQGINAVGDGLSRLEKRLVESSFQKGAWGRLLRTLIPRPELEVQIPRFSHRSIINATAALKQMGLTTLFDINKADLRGLNGVAHDLHLSDMLQFNYFSLCGNSNSALGHHSEYYPATARRSLRRHRRLDNFEQQKILHDDPLYIINYLSLPLNLRPRQARVPQVPRLRLDRPFLYFVRHNPTGFILHMGRFNPRLLP